MIFFLYSDAFLKLPFLLTILISGSAELVTLLKVFVFNEVIVGAIIIMQVIHMLLCGKISKSQHLQEIEGEQWNVDDQEVSRIRRELEESRVRSE